MIINAHSSHLLCVLIMMRSIITREKK